MANYDPNTNRMFRDDMGACNSGCKCQSCWRVTIENGEVVDYDRETPIPCHLRPLQKALDNGDVVLGDDTIPDEAGKYYYRWDYTVTGEDNWGWDFQDEGYVPQPLEVVEVNGEKYYREPCDYFYWEPYDFEDEAKKMADGEYIVTREYACFSNYVWEYGVDEGDSDVVFEVEPALKEE